MSQSERGFTLVEMLVAILIFGVIAAAGVAVMRSTIDSQAIVRAQVDRHGEFQRLRAVLKADLAQAAPRRTRSTEGLAQSAPFTGGDPATGGPLIALVRRGWENPDGAPRASMQYVEYRLEGRRLERRVRPYLDGAALGEAQVLSEGVEAAHVAFLFREQWSPAWNEASGALPDAVRLDLTLDGMGGPVTQLFLTPGRGLG
jgi:general secretion pathway protein J